MTEGEKLNDSIVTENERDFKRIPGITVSNPFKERVKR